MSESFEQKLERLSEPFPPEDVEWRVGQAGSNSRGIWCKVLAYLTNRAIMNRLDEVFGPMGWQDQFKEWHGDSQLCGISVKHPEFDEWVTKWDGADNTAVESTKGGLSDAMKRAAVKWGIGRYLYKLDEAFAETMETRPSTKDGWHYAKLKDGKVYYWKNPQLPAWALPEEKK